MTSPFHLWVRLPTKLNFGLHTFIVLFILAALSKPILGIDFLSAHCQLVDPYAILMELVGHTVSAIPSRFAASISHIAPAVCTFPSIFSDGKGALRPYPGICHFVETSGCPVFYKARCLDPDELKITKAEFRRSSKYCLSFQLFLFITAPYGSQTGCHLQQLPLPQQCHQARQVPLPSMLDLFDKLYCCKFFLCVDLVKEYHYIPMAAEGVKKTTIISPFRLFEYFFMLFGLTSAAQSPKSHGQDTSPLAIHFHLPG
jgi:hypothetical protein